MSPLIAGALARATEPSPNPTEGTLRPGLETWEVSPGLIGFVATFALAVACVLLFLSMSKHLRQAGHNAREQGLPVPAPQVVSFQRPGADGGAAQGSAGPGDVNGPRDVKEPGSGSTPGVADSSGPSDAGSSASGGGGTSGADSGGSGD